MGAAVAHAGGYDAAEAHPSVRRQRIPTGVVRPARLARAVPHLQPHRAVAQLNQLPLCPPRRRRLANLVAAPSVVAVEDTTRADHIFSVLMGDAVDPRRNFIQDNALNVRNLDI